MMQLVYEHYFTDGYTYGYLCPFTFEYSSKEDFVLEILRRIEEAMAEAKKNNTYAMVSFLGQTYSLNGELVPEDIENDTYTLEEWFNKDKREV